MCRSLIFSRLAASICVTCVSLISCSTRSRSRSRWLKAIRSVSIAPSATYESGHFYFAQTGHSHFAAIVVANSLTATRSRYKLPPIPNHGPQMSDWVYIQTDPAEQLMQVYHFSIIKQQCGNGVPFNITIKEFAVPPPGQRLRFYAEADKAVNQKSASFVPCGWGTSIFSALGDCVRLIRQFPYEGDEGIAS